MPPAGGANPQAGGIYKCQIQYLPYIPSHRGRCQYVVQHIGGHLVGCANCVRVYVSRCARLGVSGPVGHSPERDTGGNQQGYVCVSQRVY